MTEPTDFAIADVRVFDGTGLTGPCAVTVRMGRIATVGAEVPDGVDAVDGRGGTLIPGLVDCHVHVTSHGDITELSASGVTTALDMGTRSTAALLRMAGQLGATDLRTAGPPASAPGGIHTTLMGFPVESAIGVAAQAPGFVARRAAEGAAYIKLIIDQPRPGGGGTPVLDPDTIAAVVRAAGERGLLTVAHATSVEAVRRAVAAGVDVLTHVPLEAPLPADLVDELSSRGTVVVPTLVMMQAVAALPATSPAFRPGMDLANCLASVSALHRAGVTIAAGTDANTAPGTVAHVAPGASLPDELALLVAAGLSPLQAMQSATSIPAAVFGLEDRGAVVVGRRADLVLLDSDPTADLDALRRIREQWFGGTSLTRRAPR